ncbi:MAG: alpha/beta hydrolase [Phycisphaerales bacterium]|nr:alpha/beta hydrolase [Hyphomonadaceae bacterium]
MAGDGEAIVFLHAGVADRRMWSSQLAAFAPTHKVIAYDRRGFGQTRYVAQAHDWLDDLQRVLDAAGAERAVLVGCSQGGRIALNYALTAPLRVRGLVLIASAISGAPEPAFPEDVQALIDAIETAENAGDIDRVNALEAHAWLDGPQSAAGRVQSAARTLFLNMNGIALRAADPGPVTDRFAEAYARLGEIAAPSLVVSCGRDFPHIQARDRYLARTLPRTTLAELPDCAHLPSLEQPDRVTALLADFIETL